MDGKVETMRVQFAVLRKRRQSVEGINFRDQILKKGGLQKEKLYL